MQSLEIISVNIWQILISLCNLLILFLLLRKFLYKPVRKALADRQATLDAKYAQAEDDRAEAEALKARYTERMTTVEAEAAAVMQSAAVTAEQRSAEILSETKEKAGRMLRQAEEDAELEKKKARAGIRREIVEVSSALSEKMLGREIKAEDHRRMIDSFLDEMEDGDDVNE